MSDEEMEQMLMDLDAGTPVADAGEVVTAASVGVSDVGRETVSKVKPPAVVPMSSGADVPVESVTRVERPKPEVRVSSDGTALNVFIDSDQVKADISINLADLDTAMIEHAGMELHYASQTAHARRQYERVKSAIEILEAKLDAEVRTAAVGDKKPTEASIRAAVTADRRYSAAQSKLIDAQHIWKLCEAAENAFRSRKDMLLEVARDRRKEREGSLRVRENEDLRERVSGILKGGAS